MDGQKFFLVCGGPFLECFPQGGGKRICAFLWVVGFLINNICMQGLYLWLPVSRRDRSFPAICHVHIKNSLISIFGYLLFGAAFGVLYSLL